MVALMTGGGRGIGRAVALRLAKNGWDVAIAARSPEELAATAAEAGGRMLAITADVASPEQVRAMVQRTESELGPIDLLGTTRASPVRWRPSGKPIPRIGGTARK
jgi:NAD(P)-dependent dehydrogenase (short-subunit alcohol dehydrogenase family)